MAESDFTAFMFQSIDGNHHLLCQFCGDNYVHIETVYALVREEDQPPLYVTITHKGKVTAGMKPNGPVKDIYTRRQAFVLAGHCENCSKEFQIEFTQHKGNTIVSVVADD